MPPLAPADGLCDDLATVTEETFFQLCEHLSGQLWLQGLLVAVGTCFLEDAARCGVALLVAAGHMGWWVAFAGMVAGAIMGDLGLYLIGRYATQFLLSRRWVDPARLAWMEGYFNQHAMKTVVLSRFLPGTRAVAYGAAGAARYPLTRFLYLLAAAAVAQALLFLQLGGWLGGSILPYLDGPWAKGALISATVLATVMIHKAVVRRSRAKTPPRAGAERVLTAEAQKSAK
jgi:membrane protein DedA with SNARE-associated domain